jgi:hypothetical protein
LVAEFCLRSELCVVVGNAVEGSCLLDARAKWLPGGIPKLAPLGCHIWQERLK